MSKEREYAVIEQYDVGRSTFYAFGRHWPTQEASHQPKIGRITSLDVGKRVYRDGENDLIVESAEEFKARLEVEAKSKPVGSNAARLAKLVYDLLRQPGSLQGLEVRATGYEGHPGSLPRIDLVRPPNPANGHAVAVLFADGKDVVIRFEEQGGK